MGRRLGDGEKEIICTYSLAQSNCTVSVVKMIWADIRPGSLAELFLGGSFWDNFMQWGFCKTEQVDEVVEGTSSMF